MAGAASLLTFAALLAAEAPAPPAPPQGQQQGQEEDARAETAGEQAARSGAGVAPVELIPRLELRQSVAQLPGGVSARVTTAEIDIQFLDRLLFRYQGPVAVVSGPTGQISGFGDVELEAVAMLAATATFVAVAIGGVILDTASQPALGAGKKQLVLGGGAGVKPFPWWLPYLLVQEQAAIGGDSARPDINQLVLRVGNIAFGPGFQWLKLDFDTLIDFANDRGQLFGKLEVGRLLVGRVGLFMRGGTQLLGTRDLDYSIEVGVRYLFRLGKGAAR